MVEDFRRFLRIGEQDVKREVDDEIDFHLEMKARDLVDEGLPAAEASDRARASFGDRDGIARDCTGVQRSAMRRWRWRDRLDSRASDVRLSLRSLSRSPYFVATLVLTLGLGIGATSTVFSMFDALLLDPLPYPHHERMGLMFEQRALDGLGRDRFDRESYDRLRDAQETFDLTAAFTNEGGTLTGEAGAERVGVLEVSSSFFTIVGAVPAQGRLLTASDDLPASPVTAMLSYELWQRRYGGDPGVVGASITLNERSVPVVGVLTEGFPADEVRLWAGAADVFVNLSETNREHGIYTILARRADGVTWQRAREDVGRIAVALSEQRTNPFEIELVALADEVAGTARTALLAVFGAAAILLLVTCSNAATLLLSRGPEREREMALRSALGAGRKRLVRCAALECVVVGFLAAALSVVVVLTAQAALRSVAPELGWSADRSLAVGWRTIPWLNGLGIEVGVLGFTAVMALLTSFLFGLAPVVRASRCDPSSLINGDQAAPFSLGMRRGRVSLRDALTVGQVALAFILLVGGSLLVQSFLAARAADLGFTTRNVLSLYLNPSGEAYRTRAAAVGFYDDVFQELERLPGVESVGAIDGLPLTGGVGWTRVALEAMDRERWQAEAAITLRRHVTPGYLATMSIQLLSGRWFDATDADSAPRVIVVDEAFAQRMWPGRDALGERIYIEPNISAEVVGVVETIRYQPLDTEQPILFYEALLQSGDGGHGLYAVVGSETDAAALVASARSIVQSVDPDQPVIDARTMEDRLADTLVMRRLSAALLQTFGLVAVALAMVGLYATVSYGVSRSLHAMAVRLALGARERELARLVLRRTLLLTSAGALLGLLGSLGVTRLLGAVLYGVGPWDPAILLGLLVALLVAAAVAAIGPIRRAVAVDPVRHFRTP